MIDPVTLAVLKGRLEQIADEMDATLFRCAFNPIIAEAHDASHGLYHAETGATLIQGKSGLPVFVGVMSFAVRSVIDKVAAGDEPLDPGDVFIFNDPYEGGTHLSDFKLVRPYFRDGRLFCWLASVGHWHDVGGNVPGNYNPEATECFQEGILIPPVKLVRAGKLQSDVVDILQANSRLPDSLFGDLSGQLSALDLGDKRLSALLDEYGTSTVTEALRELEKRASVLMRSYIAELPDGVVSVDDHLDNDGVTDRPLRIGLDLKVEGETMTLDFRRSSPACDGPVNISRSTTVAACYVALKHVFEDVPANAGVLEPIAFEIPAGSLLDVSAPKPVGGYTETILRVIDAVFVAMSKLAPERAAACAYGTINALSITGHRPNGKRFVMFSFFGGGHGAHADEDGLNHGNAPISTATIPPVEIFEASQPVMFTQWSLRTDSGGPGKQRGGLGACYEVELLADRGDAFVFGERARFAPPGVVGGRAGALNRVEILRGDDRASLPLASKGVDIALRKGDRVRIESPGGGGYGAPRTRDPGAVALDVRLGYVSAEAARREYGVVLDERGDVDEAATVAARKEIGA